MTKYILIIASFFLLHSDTMEELSWSEDYRLTWDDFKGQPNPNTDAVAVTASGITFGYSIKKSATKVYDFDTEVKACFYPEHSWYKTERVDNHVLGHEQLHFDITELHARLFRKKLTEVKPHQNLAEILQSLHKSIEDDLKTMQKSYDAESDYSINVDGQRQWKVTVFNKLKALEAFKSKD